MWIVDHIRLHASQHYNFDLIDYFVNTSRFVFVLFTIHNTTFDKCEIKSIFGFDL